MAESDEKNNCRSSRGQIRVSAPLPDLRVQEVSDLAEPPLVGGRDVPELAAGASSTGSAPVTVPSDLPAGQYWLVACADDTNLVDETDETNNCRTSASRVDISG